MKVYIIIGESGFRYEGCQQWIAGVFDSDAKATESINMLRRQVTRIELDESIPIHRKEDELKKFDSKCEMWGDNAPDYEIEELEVL